MLVLICCSCSLSGSCTFEEAAALLCNGGQCLCSMFHRLAVLRVSATSLAAQHLHTGAAQHVHT